MEHQVADKLDLGQFLSSQRYLPSQQIAEVGEQSMSTVNRCRQSCEPSSLSGCSACNLAFECARKRQGQVGFWPATALVMLSLLGLFSYAA
jgi:hypothetical protein